MKEKSNMWLYCLIIFCSLFCVFVIAKYTKKQDSNETQLVEFENLDQLKNKCPENTKLIGPLSEEGIDISINGKRSAGCVKKNGTKHGPAMEWFDTGSKASFGKYNEGVKHGNWVFWYKNKRLKGRGSFLNGKPDGKWTSWHQNGKKESEGFYINGLHHGEFIYWDQSGFQLRTLTYQHGKLIDE